MIQVRRARLADAGTLAALAEATFRETFAAANRAADMDAHCRASYGEAIQAREIADTRRVTLLCECAGATIGYAQLRWPPAPAGVPAPSAGEIQRFYLVSKWQGRGVARTLMDACLEAMRERGSGAVWLGVWEHNLRAIAFYRKAGFAAVGEHVFTLGNDPQRDLIMARPLPAPG